MSRLGSAEYKRRVMARVCAKCEAGLQEGDGKYCVECAETCSGPREHRAARQARSPEHEGYTPLDELVERPAFRILQRLRHFDSIQSGDLLVALEIAESDYPKYRAALSALRSTGRVSVDRWKQYALTDEGRRALREQLDRARVAA